MKRIALAVVAALGLAVSSGTALAQHAGMSHGGSGGGWHGGSGHGDWHGGWHGGTHIGIGFGFPYWGFGLGYPYYAGYPYYSSYPYYASYPGYYPYPSGYTSYYTDAPVYDSGTYIQRDMNGGAPGAYTAPRGENQYSYYCPDPAGYYPQVPNCAKGWLKVVPDNSQPPR